MNYPLLTLITSTLATHLWSAEPIEVLKKHAWISDKTTTIQWLEKHRPKLSSSEKLKDLFGKMIISYADNSATTKLDSKIDIVPHKIIGQTKREVAFITNDITLNRDVIIVIEIDPDENGYWIYNSQFDIKEHFIQSK